MSDPDTLLSFVGLPKYQTLRQVVGLDELTSKQALRLYRADYARGAARDQQARCSAVHHCRSSTLRSCQREAACNLSASVIMVAERISDRFRGLTRARCPARCAAVYRAAQEAD